MSSGGGAAGPWAGLVSSSLPQGHLSSLHPSHPFHSSPFYPQLLSPLAFASLLKPDFFLLCGDSGLQGARAGEWWLLDHRTFPSFSKALTWASQRALSHRTPLFSSFSCFYPTTVCLLFAFAALCLVRDENKAPCLCRLQCKACG